MHGALLLFTNKLHKRRSANRQQAVFLMSKEEKTIMERPRVPSLGEARDEPRRGLPAGADVIAATVETEPVAEAREVQHIPIVHKGADDPAAMVGRVPLQRPDHHAYFA